MDTFYPRKERSRVYRLLSRGVMDDRFVYMRPQELFRRLGHKPSDDAQLRARFRERRGGTFSQRLELDPHSVSVASKPLRFQVVAHPQQEGQGNAEAVPSRQRTRHTVGVPENVQERDVVLIRSDNIIPQRQQPAVPRIFQHPEPLGREVPLENRSQSSPRSLCGCRFECAVAVGRWIVPAPSARGQKIVVDANDFRVLPIASGVVDVSLDERPACCLSL